MNDPAFYQQYLANKLLQTPIIDRGSWQSTTAPSPVHELEDVTLRLDVPADPQQWARETLPDLPWADEHFAERVSGEPLNPAPSYMNWPWHNGLKKEMFKLDREEKTTELLPFDHTYPERMWPKQANHHPHRMGVRFNYGDLGDVVRLLKRDPFTRQAYVPLWFPEDTGATDGQRVPCTLGYHFIRYGSQLNLKYFLRSADITRHLHNDIYMAGRLLQWVTEKLNQDTEYGEPFTGTLVVFISNLHMFTADTWRWKGTK